MASNNWFEVDIVQQQMGLADRYVADGAVSEFRETLGWAIGDCADLMESPLEAIFKLWWEAIAQRNPLGDGVAFGIEHQREVVTQDRRYRIDFVIHPGHEGTEICKKHGLSWPLIGVEVDGHAFHEKTLDQVTYRNQRDRDLQQSDWKIFHYSFSEIVRDPFITVGEVYQFSKRIWYSTAQEVWRREHPAEAAAIQAAVDKSPFDPK